MLSPKPFKICHQTCLALWRKVPIQRCVHVAAAARNSAFSLPGHSSQSRQSNEGGRVIFRRSLLVWSSSPRFFSSEHSSADPPLPSPTSASSEQSGESMTFLKFDDLSEEEQKRFQMLQFELEILRQSGHPVPSKITEKEWRKVMALSSRFSRLKFFRFLFMNEMSDINLKKKKAQASILRQAHCDQIKAEISENPEIMRYGLSFNTMFPYIRDTDMLKTYNIRLAYARTLGQPIIFDVDYDNWMSQREQTNTATQIRDSYALNKESRDPFWLQICNCRMENETMKALKSALPNMGEPSCLIEYTTKSYLDIFPRSQLVYLTYNAEATLDRFNHDDIYIIGGLVDKTNPKPLSMAKAKREGLRMAKLPLDTYLRWAVGGKNLTLNQMMGIMLDMKQHGDWEQAFLKHIPKRKYLQPEDLIPNHPNPYHRRPSATMRVDGGRIGRPQEYQNHKRRQRGVLETLLSK
ncbi:Mitochondrial ribonuclease P protein 1-like protein [Hypsibius exemplaris]|uniref:RNA (guanine-9-)-methyltransferase domain-containing protein 1 n=1 Tax=Hypsibius exemplaris TaxID=2072580 RepID=A0A1W0XDX8_HYPEX|nr:Mitochondrial ribonuclease P protein 1-like protein [Hypsibius exemplaris]